MSRNLDSTLLAALSNANLQPITLAAITFASGVCYIWSGVGDLTWNGNTYQGVGALGTISAISEGSGVQADGITVTLSGIPIPGLDLPYTGSTAPSGVTPPVTVPAGQSVAWALPTVVASSGTQTQTNCSSIYEGLIEAVGEASPLGGSVTLSGACSLTAFPSPAPYAQWSSFELPKHASLPAGSVIEAIYPVLLVSGTIDGAVHNVLVDVSGTVAQNQEPTGSPFAGEYPTSPTSLGTDLGALDTTSLIYQIARSESGGGSADAATISAAALAIYYTAGPTTLITETLDDIELGAPAKIYFGLMSDGAIVGTPYLAFSGMVDQPSLKISPETMTISLALENRLVNLQRAQQQRYTAAEQHLAYPDDSGFNWVELINDLALRWG